MFKRSQKTKLDCLMPGFRVQCEKHYVSVNAQFEYLYFNFEGVRCKFKHSILTDWADDDLYDIMYYKIESICLNLRNEYIGMDN